MENLIFKIHKIIIKLRKYFLKKIVVLIKSLWILCVCVLQNIP